MMKGAVRHLFDLFYGKYKKEQAKDIYCRDAMNRASVPLHEIDLFLFPVFFCVLVLRSGATPQSRIPWALISRSG